MWDRIGNGLIVGVKKAGGDTEIFVNAVLEFIKANSAIVAACEPLSNFLCDMDQTDENDKREFLRVIEQKRNVIIVHARNQWNDAKGCK